MIPNTHRVIVKNIKVGEIKNSGIIIPGQMQIGENLLYGEIVHPGNTSFKVGQGVFYSEYSAARIVDAKSLIDGSKSYKDLQGEDIFVVADDDIMAFYDPTEISETIK